MKLSDTRDIAAPTAVVWEAILNPLVLQHCIPGCQSMTGSVEGGFEAVVKQKIGPVSATFTGLVQLSDIIPGQRVTITGEGKGGVAGFAKGGAVVTLDPSDTGTRLTYDVEASVGGKIAQLGSRIIDSLAKKMADDFFSRLQVAVEPPSADEAADAEIAAEGDEGVADSPEKKKGWFKRLIGA